jgi:hypothetical protein
MMGGVVKRLHIMTLTRKGYGLFFNVDADSIKTAMASRYMTKLEAR